MSDELIAREHVRKWAAQNADLLFLGRVADAFINSMSASLAALLSQVRADERAKISDHQYCADEIARGEQARLLQAKLEQARKALRAVSTQIAPRLADVIDGRKDAKPWLAVNFDDSLEIMRQVEEALGGEQTEQDLKRESTLPPGAEGEPSEGGARSDGAGTQGEATRAREVEHDSKCEAEHDEDGVRYVNDCQCAARAALLASNPEGKP